MLSKCITIFISLLFLFSIPEVGISVDASEDPVEQRGEVILDNQQTCIRQNAKAKTSIFPSIPPFSILPEFDNRETHSPKVRKHLWIRCLII